VCVCVCNIYIYIYMYIYIYIMCACVRACMQVRPAILVKMLQMVERQEDADRKVRAAVQAGGAAGGGREEASSLVRCWYGKALDSLHAYMDTKFEMLCSSLADASTINVPALISGHANIMDDIVQVWGRAWWSRAGIVAGAGRGAE